jgi:hypothetical protein
MSIAYQSGHAGTVDTTTGRLLPLTEEELQARREAILADLDENDATTDETDTDEVWREVMRGINESRPHRPLFEGMY